MKGRKHRIWKLILGAAVVLTMLPVQVNADSASEIVSGEFTIAVSDFKENDQLIENNPQVTAQETTITYLGDGNYTLSYQMDIAAADGTYRMPEKTETEFQWESCLEPLAVQIPQTSFKADQTQTEGYSWVLTITRAANTEHTLENREKASNCTHQGYEKDGCVRCAHDENVSWKELDPGKHDYTWQTDEDGNQMHICSYNAEHNGTCSGGEEATCTDKSICSTCRNTYGRYAHELVYTAEGSVITESCTKNCAHSASAELILDSGISRIYSGSEIEPLTIQYSGDWEGSELTIQYQDNVDATTETKKALGRISAGENVIAEKTFDIEKASLKITADDQTCFYGDPVPAFTAKTEGLIMGESSADVIQGTPVFTCAYTPESPVGSYTIKADISGLSADNYTVTAVDGTLSVAQRELTIQWGNTEFLYDEASHVPAYTVGNTVNGDVITLTVSGETAEAGEHEAVVTGFSGDNQDNYKLPENLQIRFSILCAAPSSPAAQGETILNKGDGKITGVDSTMEYRAENETAYHSISGTEVINLKAGKYLVRTKAADGKPASYAKEVTVEAGTPLTISIPAEQKGYTLTVDPAQVGWNEEVKLTFALKPYYEKLSNFAVKVNGDTVKLKADDTAVISGIQKNTEITVEGIDRMITVEFGGETYSELTKNITFEKYLNKLTLTVTAPENATIEYSEQNVAKDPKSINEWKTYEDSVTFSGAERNVVCYVKVTKESDEVVYVSTNGVVFDQVKPVLNVERAVYYTTLSLTATDANLDHVAVDTNKVTIPYTLEGNKDGRYAVMARDKAGNWTSVTVTMKPIAELDNSIEHLTTENVTANHRNVVETVLGKVNGLEGTPEEEEELTAIKENCEKLLSFISIKEIVKPIEKMTTENVKVENKKTVEDVLAKVKAWEGTEEEEKLLLSMKDRCQMLLDIIAIKEIAEPIDGLTKDNMKPDNRDTVQDVLDDIKKETGTTAEEKKLLEELADKCEELLENINYSITTAESSLKWTKGSKKDLTIKTDADDSTLKTVRIGGTIVAKTNYTFEDGTLTLKASYLQKTTVKAGKHTIELEFEDGSTGDDTKIEILTSNPKTGDNSHLVIWCLAAGFSAAGLAVAVLTDRKRRYQA